MRRELVCVEPSSTPRLLVRQGVKPLPQRGQVLVRVEATAVNPIDAKRAGGYGRRLLDLKGAGHFPQILGNDLAGRVEAVGAGVPALTPGQRVFGLLGTGRGGGAHASHVVVPQTQLRPAPAGAEAAALAVLPYSFTTMWLAVRSVRISPANARGRKVLVHGAAGALGRLALQLLSGWGCRITAICGADSADECLALGACTVVERGPQAVGSLPADFDAVLNFASWDDELALASRLGTGALGQATTVHPLLSHFDRLRWLRGALASRRDMRRVQAAVRQRSAGAQYAWTLFKPDGDALDALAEGVDRGRFALPVGTAVGLDDARSAFAHVMTGRAGRAVLQP